MAGKGNPNWRKGGPSPNPTGAKRARADAFTAPRLAGLAAAIGPHLDGYQNAVTGLGGRMDKTVGTTFCPDIVDANEAELIWRGDPIAARLVEMRAEDATSDQPELVIGDVESPEWHEPQETARALPGGSDVMPSGKGLPKNGRTDMARPLNAWERRVVQAVGRQRRRADAADTKSMSEEISHSLGDNGLKAMAAIKEAIQYRDAYGGSAIFLGANDYTTDLRQPLDLKRVRSLDYVTPLEARELYPLFYYNDPFQPNFGRPAIYQLTPYTVGAPINPLVPLRVQQIHESRLIVFDGPRVSRRNLFGALPGWGDSVYTRVFRALKSYGAAIQNIDVLLSSFAQAIYKIKGLAASLLQNPNALTDAMMAVELCRSMVNAVIIDEGEEFTRESVSLAGYADVIDRLAINVAAAAGMPLTRLFGTSAKGMNATGANDEAFYFGGVGKIQTHVVAPAYLRMVEIEMAIRGEDPVNTTHSLAFKPLYRPSEGEIASTRLAVAQADHIYITDEVVSREEIALSRFGGDTWSMETHLDLEARAEQMSVIPPAVNATPEPDPNDPNADPNADPTLDEDGNPDGEGVDGEDSPAYDDLIAQHADEADDDPEGDPDDAPDDEGDDDLHEDSFNAHQVRGPDGKWLATGSKKPAGEGRGGGGKAAPSHEVKAKGVKGAAKPKAAPGAKSKAAPAAKAAPGAKSKAAPAAKAGPKQGPKLPSATTLQKHAGVSSKSAAGAAIKAHVAAGDHHKAIGLANAIKTHRETLHAQKAADKEAKASAKAERETAKSAKAAAKEAAAKLKAERTAAKTAAVNDKSVAEFPHTPAPAYKKMTKEFYQSAIRDSSIAGAFTSYSSISDRRINSLLRINKGDVHATNAELKRLKDSGEDRKLPHGVHNEIGHLDRQFAISKAPADMAVYRTVADTNGMFLNMKAGATFTDHGYTSTSASKKIHSKDSFEQLTEGSPLIQGHATQVNVVIGVRKGSSVAPMEKLSKYAHEHEVLLPRGNTYKITKVSKIKGIHTIHMEVHTERS